MPHATDGKGFQRGLSPAHDSNRNLSPTPIAYKIFRIAPGVTRACICAFLERACGGTLLDTHFFGRAGINIVFSVAAKLQHPDQEERIASGIAALTHAASPLPLLSVLYKSKPRCPTRLLHVAALARGDDGSIPDDLPEEVIQYVGVSAAHWVAGKVAGNVDLCMSEVVEMAQKSDTRQSIPGAVPQKRLEVMLQLTSPKAVQQALGLTHSSLDMLTVRYPGGYIYLYVSQSGHKRKGKWHVDILYSVSSRRGAPSMPPPLNGCCIVEEAEHASPASNLPDDYDDYSDYLSRVPAAVYNAGSDVFDGIGYNVALPHPFVFAGTTPMHAEMLHHTTDGYTAGSYDFDGTQQYMANGCSIAASASQPYHAYTGAPLCAPTGCTYEPVEPMAAANGCSIAAFAQPYQSDAPLCAPAGCTDEPAESRCMSESADDMDAVLPYL